MSRKPTAAASRRTTRTTPDARASRRQPSAVFERCNRRGIVFISLRGAFNLAHSPRVDASSSSRRWLAHPECDVDRLHRLADDGAQLSSQSVEVDLLPQADGKRLDRASRVVASPVEAT